MKGQYNLVIVESAAKSKTISKYLNSSKELKEFGEFVVAASFGHVRDLKKKELGIDTEHGFKPDYQIIPDKKKTIEELKKKLKDCKDVYLAADPDREGESIAAHLKDVLNLKTYKRITFSEITKNVLEKAIKNPRLIDFKLVDAQETRRILDRLVGFKLSPLLWRLYKTNSTILSAGRVQSAALHLIILREKQIRGHKSEAYWTLNGSFELTLNDGNEKHHLADSKMYSDGVLYRLHNIEHITSFLKNLKNRFSINDIYTKLVKQSPDFPFITSTLQQESYGKLGFSLKKTMQLAQDLYENGFITYMRTDSFNMSEKFKDQAEKYIRNKYGEDYYGGGRSKKIKGAQEAHECIRITDVNLEELASNNTTITKDHNSLYNMIWKRTIASLMKPCIYDELHIKIQDSSFEESMWMLNSFKKLRYNGYLVIYGHKNEKYDFSDILENVKNGKYKLVCLEIFCKNIWSSPPQRYNDSSFVKLLESEGIGRPSTYSSILSKIIERQYVVKSNINGVKYSITNIAYDPYQQKIIKKEEEVEIGAEQNKLVATDIGIEIDNFLENTFHYIVDKNFTAVMENDLDMIARGDKQRLEVLTTFWESFSKDLSKVKLDTSNNIKKNLKTEENIIEYEGKSYTIRLAKYGPVIQYDDQGTKKYINLKSYLSLTKKEYTNINKEDIKFMMSLPKQLMNYKNDNVILAIGQYGLYLKYNNKNLSIPKRIAFDFIKGVSFSEKTMDEIYAYHMKKKSKKSKDSKEYE